MAEITRLRRWVRFLSVLTVGLVALSVFAFWRTPSEVQVQAMEPDEVEELKARLVKSSYAERIRILHKLGRSPSQQAESTVLEMLRNARTDRERLEAISQLGRVGTSAAVAELAEIVDSSTRRSLQRQAISALGRIGSESAVSQLLSILNNKHQGAYLRRSAALALGRAGTAPAITALTRLAVDPEDEARHAGISALGRTGSDDARTPATSTSAVSSSCSRTPTGACSGPRCGPWAASAPRAPSAP